MTSLLSLPRTLRTSVAVSVLALGLGLSATAMTAAQEIVVGIGAEPATLDPQALDDGAERAVNDNIYETLYVRDAAGELSPGLAADLPVQVDELTWEITLREGISFHNGEPFDAEAVAYSLNRIIDPELASNQFSYASTISGAEVVDPLTVRVTTEAPDPALTARLYWIKIVPPVYGEDPGFADAPVGTGPFRFSRWDRGQEVVLEANADYWGDAPEIEGLTFRFIPEASTRFAGLLSGELDLITNVAPEFVPQLPNVATVQGLELPFILLNAEEGSPLADTRVRQALLQAIDREALAEGLFEGYATVSPGPLAVPSAFGFDASIEGYSYDPELARQLLEEAGAAGASFEFVGPGGRFLNDRETVEAIAAFWTEVGLDVTVTIPEWSEYLSRIFNEDTRPDVFYSSSANELFDADRAITAYYHQDSPGASNDDAELAEWIDQARFETDVDARQALYSQILQRAEDEALVASLLNVQDIYGLSERLTWEPRVDGKLILSTATVSE
jgi:peptide/nickel transport system substrate-binding protein